MTRRRLPFSREDLRRLPNKLLLRISPSTTRFERSSSSSPLVIILLPVTGASQGCHRPLTKIDLPPQLRQLPNNASCGEAPPLSISKWPSDDSMSLTNPPSSGSISARARTVNQNLKRSLQSVDGNYMILAASLFLPQSVRAPISSASSLLPLCLAKAFHS